MPEPHIPKLGGHGGKPFGTILLEVTLIGFAVFLGLLGEQWRESAHNRELAHETLRRFRAELAANRKAIADVMPYHVDRMKELEAYFAATKPEDRAKVEVHLTRGIAPAFLEHSVWDLAVANQSLAYIDADLAFALSSLYNTQQAHAQLQQAFLQGMFAQPPGGTNEETGLSGVRMFVSDASLIEPRLIAMYDKLLPQLDKVIADE
jgi:hypothetical protein